MSKYPIFLEVQGKRTVLIGGGTVAFRKAKALIDRGARLVLIAEQINDNLVALAKGDQVELIRSKYSKEYLAEATLVIAATNDMELNKEIYKHCQELEVLCNVVDQPELCDFFVPAVVKRGDLQIAVGTEGSCPAYAGHLKKKLETMITEEHGNFLKELENVRQQIMKDIDSEVIRKAIMSQLVADKSFDHFAENGSEQWHQWVNMTIDKLNSKFIS